MAKILVIVLGFLIAFWMLKRYFKNLSRGDEPPRGVEGEDMVRCEKCGLNLPRSESIAVKSVYYCSPEHARERQRSDG